MSEKEILTFKTPAEFEKWLRKYHATSPGLWLRFLKKAHKEKTRAKSITYAEAFDVSLCYGWIDSTPNKLDAISYIQRFSPRGRKSIWSKLNREHVARLIQTKKMRPSGLAHVESAKKDGRWAQAYDSPANMKVPADFLRALAQYPKAERFFTTLNKSNTYAIAFRLNTAKKPDTRAKRMQVIIAMMRRQERFH